MTKKSIRLFLQRLHMEGVLAGGGGSTAVGPKGGSLRSKFRRTEKRSKRCSPEAFFSFHHDVKGVAVTHVWHQHYSEESIQIKSLPRFQAFTSLRFIKCSMGMTNEPQQ